MNRKQRRAQGDAKSAAALNNEGAALASAGKLREAARAYQRAVAAEPNYAPAWCNLGDALDALGDAPGAVAAYRRAIEISPTMLNGFYNLGVTLAKLGDLHGAVACYRRALEIKPDFVEAQANLAAALVEIGGVAEAEALCRRAVAMSPQFAMGWHNLGIALHRQRRLDEAAVAYKRALALRPGDHLFAHNLGTLLLAKGEFADGWALYEARFEVAEMGMPVRRFAQPRWRGEAGGGRTLLIHAEQGLGDTLQFCRYAKLAAGRGWRVVMEVQAPLVRLLDGLDGVSQLIGQNEPLPDFDAQIPMMSLPALFPGEPPKVPYLAADAALVAAWGERVAAIAGPVLKVGLVWAGSRRSLPGLAAADGRRSMAPELLLPVLAVPGVAFFSLQKEQTFDPPAGVAWTDWMNEVVDFADTAALVANLDLVIAVDTSVAHVAGAIGKPVWLLNRFDSCWRWLDGRRDSVWYPGLRIYGQSQPGDWAGLVAEVAADLAKLSGG